MSWETSAKLPLVEGEGLHDEANQVQSMEEGKDIAEDRSVEYYSQTVSLKA
jgi:hypothetical protein